MLKRICFWTTFRSLRPVFQYLRRNRTTKTDCIKPKPKCESKKKSKPTVTALKPDNRLIKIYRFDGTSAMPNKPRMQTFELDVNTCGRMILDVLIKLKEMDPSLTFRRSCREGICGSCAVNVQGSNCLACTRAVPKAKTITIYPLPHMYVIRDLVVDMDHFIASYNSIQPYLQRDICQLGETQIAQSARDAVKMNGLYECVLCSCCSTSCPSYWWNGRRFLGPAALLHAYRWVIDSRDTATYRRLQALQDDFKLFRCHTIMNCVLDCPKGLNPSLAIAKLKLLVSKMSQKEKPDLDPMKFKKLSPFLKRGQAKYQ